MGRLLEKLKELVAGEPGGRNARADLAVLERELTSEERGEALTRRRALVADLAHLEAEHVAEFVNLQARQADALDHVRTTEAARRAASQALATLTAEIRRVRLSYDHDRARLEAELIATADPRITLLVDVLDVWMERLRTTDVRIREEKHWLTERVTSRADSAGLLAQIEAVRRTRAAAVTLRSEALDDAELSERLDALLTDLHAVAIENGPHVPLVTELPTLRARLALEAV